MALKYKVGDRVRIKSLDWYNKNKTKHGDIWFDDAVFTGGQSLYCGCELTIRLVTKDSYYVVENDYYWTDEMIEGLVEEEFEVDLIPKFGEYSDNESLDIPTMTTEFVKEHGLPCPEGYIFKDENGNIINAQKIVLEKKGKEYPKTYKECCRIIGFCSDTLKWDNPFSINRDTHPYIKHLDNLLESFCKLLICRAVYWKIAGDEMGLGKPWKPDWTNQKLPKYCIAGVEGQVKTAERYIVNTILAFPTTEMRDAFYENFKKEIEQCKELL